jgi:hypothetical protein
MLKFMTKCCFSRFKEFAKQKRKKKSGFISHYQMNLQKNKFLDTYIYFAKPILKSKKFIHFEITRI